MLDDYIKNSWSSLLRNTLDIAFDPKVDGGRRSYLYISGAEDPEALTLQIKERRKLSGEKGPIEIRVLPEDLTVTEDHGLLYLPNDYVVPGGRFNEMYAWDSYWIVLGLLRDGYASIARGIVENFIYEIRHYGGKVLNANRTYYLTRSQPPMLAPMALAVLPTLPPEDKTSFLQSVAEAIALEYEGFWKTSRYDSEIELFHYGNSLQGELGLCPEVIFGERDEEGYSHYDKIAFYLRSLPETDPVRKRFLDQEGELTKDAIAGDRAMRESGFDASMHMGYYGLETVDFSPVCLNSLLYVECQLLASMFSELGRPERAKYFQDEATGLQTRIRRILWNDDAKLFSGFNRLQKRASNSLYLTCAYPLWAGIATPEQARWFRDNLPMFETAYGLKGTDEQTGCQWDAPFMWAPLVYISVAGLQRYGYGEEARRIAKKFVETVERVNKLTGANFEKYNATTGGIRTEGIIEVGYSENVVGFGWTNGACAILKDWLEKEDPAAIFSLASLKTALQS